MLGKCENLRSDSGSNFVGVEKEPSKGFLEMNQNKIRRFLQNFGSNWIIWKKNPLGGSLLGGIWEHQIRSARGQYWDYYSELMDPA